MWSRQVVTLKQQQAKCELAGCHTGWESSGEIQPGSCHALDFIDLGDIQLPPEQPQPGPFPCHTIWSTETPDFLVSRPYKKQHSFSCLLCARPSHPLLPLLSPVPLVSLLSYPVSPVNHFLLLNTPPPSLLCAPAVLFFIQPRKRPQRASRTFTCLVELESSNRGWQFQCLSS